MAVTTTMSITIIMRENVAVDTIMSITTMKGSVAVVMTMSIITMKESVAAVTITTIIITMQMRCLQAGAEKLQENMKKKRLKIF